jgi:hypothetical protein
MGRKISRRLSNDALCRRPGSKINGASTMPSDKTTYMAGGCACGTSRFAIATPPIIVHACHCHACQRRTGSAFAVNAMIETDAVSVLAGELNAEEDGAVMRCAACGQALWGHHPACGRGIAIFPVGLLDEADRLSPDVHCFTASKHRWIALPPDVPAYAGNYESNEVLDSARLSRLQASLP